MYTVEIYFLGHPSQAVISNSDRANRVIVMNSVVQLIEHHFKLEGEIEKKIILSVLVGYYSNCEEEAERIDVSCNEEEKKSFNERKTSSCHMYCVAYPLAWIVE